MGELTVQEEVVWRPHHCHLALNIHYRVPHPLQQVLIFSTQTVQELLAGGVPDHRPLRPGPNAGEAEIGSHMAPQGRRVGSGESIEECPGHLLDFLGLRSAHNLRGIRRWRNTGREEETGKKGKRTKNNDAASHGVGVCQKSMNRANPPIAQATMAFTITPQMF